MTDIEKVMLGLQLHALAFWDDDRCCPYFGSDKCTSQLCNDALELLKEQQSEIERLEHDLAVTQDNLNYYVNGNA